ncbi:serine hydrolase domain-containing protein [Kitasatospora sp. NPDC096147]|uniref:serine hydrolase domain-containing protein n=1 Tax=Kitasatospora sp. NPDC096147 TaxID=3364093 RepID=UPI00380681B1
MAKGMRGAGLRAAAVALAAATVVGVVAPVAGAAGASEGARSVSVTAEAEADAGAVAGARVDRAALDAALRAVVVEGGSTAALGRLVENGRTVWQGAAGKADLDRGTPARADGRFRIGSVTKTFVATVLLQLEAERRVDLDAPVERYLPGTVPNGRNITVRQLLNHTSGVYNYTEDRSFQDFDTPEGIRRWLDHGRWADRTPAELVRIAVAHEPYFAPGTDWHYSNTNYVLAGMIVEKVTGRSWNAELERRIVRPLGLTSTSFPTTDTAVPGVHAKGYLQLPDGGRADVTRLNPSMAGAAGAGISSTADLAKFNAALLGGRLLPKAQLNEMTTVTPQSLKYVPYGLGLMREDTPCGTYWGHGGGIPGYGTQILGQLGGKRQLSFSYNAFDNGKVEEANRTLGELQARLACGTAAPAAGGTAPSPSLTAKLG